MILLLQILRQFLFMFFIGYSWTFNGTVYSFESYGAFVGFGFDNSKVFGDGCFNSFEDGVAEL